MNIDYLHKYIKYKTKYNELKKKKFGGSYNDINNITKFSTINILDKIPHIYTLFDGFLNNNYGSNYKKNLDVLNSVLKKIDDNKILNLSKLKNNLENYYIKLNLFDRDCIISSDKFSYKKSYDFNYKIIIEKLEKEFKFLNYESKLDLKFGNFGTCHHAITFLITKDYLVVINSGDGITEYHKENSMKYNLWKSYKFNEEKREYFLKKLLIFDLFKSMYAYLQQSSFPLKSIYSDVYHDIEIDYEKFESFINPEIVKKSFNIYQNSINISKKNLHKKQLIQIYTELLDDLKEEKETNENTFLKKNFNFEEFNNKWEEKKKENGLTKKVFNRYTFTYLEGNLYCNPQKSGSCAWYSIFWTLLILCVINEIDVYNFYLILIEFLRKDLVDDFEKSNENIINGFDFNSYKIINLLCDLKYMNCQSKSIYKNFNSLNYFIKLDRQFIFQKIKYIKPEKVSGKELKNFEFNKELKNYYNYNKYLLEDLLKKYKPKNDMYSSDRFWYIEKNYYNYNYENISLSLKLSLFFSKFIQKLSDRNINYSNNTIKPLFNNDKNLDDIFDDNIEEQLFNFFKNNQQEKIFIEDDKIRNDSFNILNIFEYKIKNYNKFCLCTSDLSEIMNFYYVSQIIYTNPNYTEFYFNNEKKKNKFLFRLFKYYFLNITELSLKLFLYKLNSTIGFLGVFTSDPNDRSSLIQNKRILIKNSKDIYLDMINLLLDNLLIKKVFFTNDSKYNKNILNSNEEYNKFFYNLNDNFDDDKLVKEIKEKINYSSNYDDLKKKINSIDFKKYTNNPFRKIEIINDNRIKYKNEEYELCTKYEYGILENFKFKDIDYNLFKKETGSRKIIEEKFLYCLNLNNSNIIKNFDSTEMYVEIIIKNDEIIEMKIDDYDVILKDNNIEKYPFLLFSPILTTNYILQKNNTFYLLFLSKLITDENINIFTQNPLKKNITYMYLCEISNNFFTPNFKNIENYDLLLDIYSYYGCNEKIIFNFNFQNDKKILEKDFRLINDYNPEFNLEKNKEESIKYVEKNDIDNLMYCSLNKININEFYNLKLNFVNIDVLLLKIKNYFTLLDFKDEKFDQTNLNDFIKKNPLCKLSKFDENFKLEINKSINSLVKLIKSYRETLCENLDFSKFNEGGYFEILKNNYEKFLKIMQLNILHKNINNLIKIVEESDDNTSCKEFSEISKLLEIPSVKRENQDFILLIFEQIFGNIINQEQWNKFYEILDSYKNKKNKIYQFAMGKGKSSVITPLLILYFAQDKSVGRINVIIPSHLKCQTVNSLKLILKIFNLKYNKLNVLTDNEAKFKFLNEKSYFNENDIIIFDEIDLMYDPIKSNFNLIVSNKKTYFEKYHIEYIINKIEGRNPKEIIENLDSRIDNILKINNIKNINYGMSKNIFNLNEENCDIKKYDNKNIIHHNEEYDSTNETNSVFPLYYEDNDDDDAYRHRKELEELYILKNKKKSEIIDRFVIPYERKDSPLEGSQFSSILITLVLTIKYFKEDNYNLEENDFRNMYKNNNFPPDYEDFENNSLEIFIKLALDKQKTLDNKRKEDILIDYLDKFVINNITYTDNVSNCSFIDLMNINCKWKTGFSGTININLEDLKIKNKFETEISKDSDEELGVYYALTGEYPNSKNELYNLKKTSNNIILNDENQIINLLKNNNYNCLIDILGYFKDFSNKEIITYIRDNINNYSDYDLVYLDDNDNIMLYDGNKYLTFDKFNNPSKTFIFFSQKNIVGIDIKNQPISFRGLAIIDENSTYTNVAQGIFRMRKLNKGQIIDIVYFSDNDENKIKIYEKLKENDNNVKIGKNNNLYLQILKYYFRLISKDYNQNYNTPNFIVEKKLDEKIKKKLNEDKITYVKYVLINHLSNYELEDNYPSYINLYDNDVKQNIKIFYDKIMKLDNIEIENLLFGSSNYEKNINIDKNIDVEIEKDIDIEFKEEIPHVDYFPENIDLKLLIKNNIIYCEESKINIDEITMSIDDNIKLSINLFNYISDRFKFDINLFMNFFVIKINNKYIFSNLQNDKYVSFDKYPIFNRKLECINNYNLDDKIDIEIKDYELKKKLKNIFKVFCAQMLNEVEIDNFNKYLKESDSLNLFFNILLKSNYYKKYKHIFDLNKKNIRVNNLVENFNNKNSNSISITKLSEENIRKKMNDEINDEFLENYFKDTKVGNQYNDIYYLCIFENIEVDSFYEDTVPLKFNKIEFKKSIMRSFIIQRDFISNYYLSESINNLKLDFTSGAKYGENHMRIFFKEIPHNPFDYGPKYDINGEKKIDKYDNIDKRTNWYPSAVLDNIYEIFELGMGYKDRNDRANVITNIKDNYDKKNYFIVKGIESGTFSEKCINIFCKKEYLKKLEEYIANLKFDLDYLNKFYKPKIEKIFEFPYVVKSGEKIHVVNNFKVIDLKSEFLGNLKIFYEYDNDYKLTKFMYIIDNDRQFPVSLKWIDNNFENIDSYDVYINEFKKIHNDEFNQEKNILFESLISNKETIVGLKIGNEEKYGTLESIKIEKENNKYLFKVKITDINYQNLPINVNGNIIWSDNSKDNIEYSKSRNEEIIKLNNIESEFEFFPIINHISEIDDYKFPKNLKKLISYINEDDEDEYIDLEYQKKRINEFYNLNKQKIIEFSINESDYEVTDKMKVE